MSRRLALAWLLLSVVGSSTLAQIPIHRDLLPTRTTLARVGLERHWMALVPIVGNERLLRISIADGLLFAQTSDGNFYAFDAESGRQLWVTNLGRRIGIARPASVNSRLVFVANSNYLYALDRQTGRIVWAQNLYVLPTSATTCDEDRVMVGLSNGKLLAFNLIEPGDKTKALLSQPKEAWNWQTNGPLTSRPMAAGQFVAFGGHDGKLYVALAEKPATEPAVMLYRIATGGEILANLGAYGQRLLLVPSADKNVYAVDLFTADVKWTYSTGAPVLQEPLVADTDAYVANTAGLLTAIDVNTGAPRWTISTQGGRLISVSGTRVYLESHDNDLFIVDRATGRMLASPEATFRRVGLNLREFTLGPTNSLDDRLYFGTGTGLILCLREIGQLAPRLLRDPKLRPFGSVPPAGLEVKPPVQPPAETPSTEPKPEEGTPPAEGTAATGGETAAPPSEGGDTRSDWRVGSRQ
jgi:outer membrane protein assembly factor BamB